jgi:hypothetical protein
MPLLCTVGSLCRCWCCLRRQAYLCLCCLLLCLPEELLRVDMGPHSCCLMLKLLLPIPVVPAGTCHNSVGGVDMAQMGAEGSVGMACLLCWS